MFKFSANDIKSDYKTIKNLAFKAYSKGKLEKSLEFVKIAANLAYYFNFIYTDKDLEDLLKRISGQILDQKVPVKTVRNRIVFYDFFGLDNRGLTQQYIRAFISWDIEFLYILENYEPKNSKNIINELEDYSKATILILDKSLSTIEKIRLSHSKIIEYEPEKAFLHLSPWNVAGVTLWNALDKIERYQVNLTDHAFWLGVDCIDYSIEFRNYGYTVSYQKRGIPKEKILIQPYYPITECDQFKGFPEDVIENNSVLIFTGGAFYKMYGENNKFFEIIKTILDDNPVAKILVAGNGDDEPIKRFIKKNKYFSRLILIGNRSDINYVFQNCDIYLSTFPFTGGLMAQYAAFNGKPILSYTSREIPFNNLEDIFQHDGNVKITYESVDELRQECKKLIEDRLYRIEKGRVLKQLLIDEKTFNNNLHQLITGNRSTSMIVSSIKINYEKFANLYLELENYYIFSYRHLILSNFKINSIYLFPKVVLNSINSKFFSIFINRIIRLLKPN